MLLDKEAVDLCMRRRWICVRWRSICSLERCGLGAVDLQLQMEMEERWMEATDAGDAERRPREEEWRAAMVALGEERPALVCR